MQSQGALRRIILLYCCVILLFQYFETCNFFHKLVVKEAGDSFFRQTFLSFYDIYSPLFQLFNGSSSEIY